MTPKLRPYQVEDTAAVLDAWTVMRRPALQWATGLGKTVLLSEIARINLRAYGMRTCIFVHRDELVQQTVDKLRAADSNMTIGIVQGPSMGIYADVVVASIQTLVRRLAKIKREQFPRIIVDECHHAAAASYVRCLEHFGAFDDASPTRALGVTATMARGDRKGLGGVWDKVISERPIAWGVEQGYLCGAEVRTVALAGLDTDKVRKGVDGDLAAGDLGRAMSSIHAGAKIAEAYATYGQDAHGRFRRAISFAPTIEIAQAWAGDYERAGARVAVITGTTPIPERRAAYADVAAGRKDVLSSVMVLTEGFDLPAVEVAIVGRPTKSMPLLTQMVGRVLRPSEATGKQGALLLDVVGALGRGLARSHDLRIPRPEDEIAPPQLQEDEPRPPREKIVLKPPTKVEWLALDLLGRPIPKGARRKTHAEPRWLRTYGGVAFLPRTPSYPWRVFCWVREGAETPWWRKGDAPEPEPMTVAQGVDPRELHPGLPLAWDDQPPAEPQRELLVKLRLPVPPTKREASDLIETYFASRELDAICRPRLVTNPPGCE